MSERFFRAETARNTPGAGLGLSLVQAIVQLHGGVLRLRSNAPGLSVRMVLPVAREAARPRFASRAPVPLPPAPPPDGVTETSHSPHGGDT